MNQTTLMLTGLMALGATSLPVAAQPGTFGDDMVFLKKHTQPIVLSDKSGAAKVVVVPAWQGRIMTSTARGDQGTSFGWVNRELIAAGKLQPHINVFGGEDRFWLGPEGGQFSIFFAPGAAFDLEHWFTPAAIDTEPFEVVRRSTDRVLCHRQIQLTNYSGTRFEVSVDREIRLVDPAAALAKLGAKLPADVKAVGVESVNTIKNTGPQPWQKDTGLLSIWILGMFNASPQSTVVIPFASGSVAERGQIVNDSYFGKVPADRLLVKDDVLFFRADANYRSKIGIPPRRAKSVLGSYDSASRTLTIVQFTLLPGVTDYVNSMWELQKEPFGGDAVNSYNDNGKLGRFYELESSSPALALKSGGSATHKHQTLHLQGDEKELDQIARAVLHVSLKEISSAFAK